MNCSNTQIYSLYYCSDLAHALGQHVKQQLSQQFVKDLLNECIKSDSQQTQDVATWAKEVNSKCIYDYSLLSTGYWQTITSYSARTIIYLKQQYNESSSMEELQDMSCISRDVE
jgi:hypothetical protein